MHHKEQAKEDVDWNYVALDGCKMWDFVNMVKNDEIFETLTENSLLTEELGANWCKTFKGIIEEIKGGKKS